MSFLLYPTKKSTLERTSVFIFLILCYNITYNMTLTMALEAVEEGG